MLKENMKQVLITGGSGLVGGRLTELLEKKNYRVAHLSRSQESTADREIISWDVNKMNLSPKAIEKFDHIIHLAGAGIVDEPWTEKRKKVIVDSRVKSAQLLAKAIAQNEKKPESFVSASAVGFYGFVSGEHVFSEEDPSGNDFLGQTCQLWEESVEQMAKMNIPTAKIRIGIVLSEKGGALKEMARPIKMGFGAALGSGKQYLPWIHIDDLCGIFIHAMENKLKGAYNAAAPVQHNNKTFTKKLAKVLNKPLWLPNVPEFVMKIILGKRALLVLEGSRVAVDKIQATGFKFKYDSLESALENLYKKD